LIYHFDSLVFELLKFVLYHPYTFREIEEHDEFQAPRAGGKSELLLMSCSLRAYKKESHYLFSGIFMKSSLLSCASFRMLDKTFGCKTLPLW
jgi:hypothetical protein